MPSINLRLSEQQHADLERWANDGHRSLQKEIIFRLFSEHAEAVRQVAAAILPPDIPSAGVREPRRPPPNLDAEGISLDAERGKTARPSTVDQDWLARRAGKKQ